MTHSVRLSAALVLSILILGCASSKNDEQQLRTYSGGSRTGDATSFFWYTENFSLPYQGSDYVVSKQHGWYQTYYRWLDSRVSEIVRKGEMLGDGKLVPFSLHLRFNSAGEAVYQQYRVDRAVRPLQNNTLQGFLAQAEAIASDTKNQQELSLIQGYWDGKQFETCSGEEYEKLEFNKTLPSFVIDRLANIDNYLAFIGVIRFGEIYIEELLILDGDDHDCIEPFED
jgi:hypothetical protein